MSRRYSDDPNFDGPLSTPWPVWIGITAVALFALWVAFTGPQDVDDHAPDVTPSVTVTR